jgi:hypothetical protein
LIEIGGMKIPPFLFGNVNFYSYLCILIKNNKTMRVLIVTTETFTKMLSGLIASGVTFDAIEEDANIVITFTGGY